MQAELILLRVLGFELRLSLPLDFVERYLERALEDVTAVGEDYEEWGREGKEEYGVVGGMDTGVGRACRSKAIEAWVIPRSQELLGVEYGTECAVYMTTS